MTAAAPKDLLQLRSLEISATQVTDAGLLHLKELARLQSIDLTGTKVSDTGLKYLNRLEGTQHAEREPNHGH